LDHVRHIFRWDLDKTYLKTEFDSFTDLVRTARLSAEQRENIPGSAALIRTIRHAQAHESEHLVFFISGSPEQLRSVLEKKFTLDGFHPDGFQLKPTVSNILRGRFRAVRGQVSYKLGQLLQGRSEAPIGTKETLFGDDAESDAFIYSLYADMVAGRVSQEHLEKVLLASGAYRSQINEVLEALEAIVHENPVRRIIIHLDQHTPPVAFQPYFPRVVPIYNHLQTALVLVLDRTLDAPSIQRVAWELLDRYGFEAPRLLNLAEDILRRRRAYHEAEDFEWLASEIDKLDNPDGPADAETVSLDELSNQTRDLMADIASLARHLADRPMPPASGAGRRNYLQMWKDEETRQDEAKRARKVAAKISRDEERARAKLAKEAKQLAKGSGS
jgi:hypothetical protein